MYTSLGFDNEFYLIYNGLLLLFFAIGLEKTGKLLFCLSYELLVLFPLLPESVFLVFWRPI